MNFLFRSAVAVLLLTAGVMATPAQQTDNTPPKELLQFVHEAARSGAKEDKIKQQAIAVGWPAAVVDQAIAYDKGEKGAKTANSDGTTAAAKVQPAPETVAASASDAAPGKTTSEGTMAVGAARNMEVPQDYQIAAGDTLQISVWKEPEVSVQGVIVRPDGKISVPLIKEIEVAGMTPPQVEKMVTDKLAKFYTDANVTVVVTTIGAKKIYVTGGVRKEGPVPYAFGMTVMQAISEAGGLTDYAKRKKIYILRSENGIQYRLDFNYDEVVKGIRMDQNILLMPGDTVVVPN